MDDSGTNSLSVASGARVLLSAMDDVEAAVQRTSAAYIDARSTNWARDTPEYKTIQKSYSQAESHRHQCQERLKELLDTYLRAILECVVEQTTPKE